MNMLDELRFIIAFLVLTSHLLYVNFFPVIDCERDCRSYFAMIVRREEPHPSIGFTTNALFVVHTILGLCDFLRLGGIVPSSSYFV